MQLSGYDAWLEPPDDGVEEEVQLTFQCENEWPVDPEDPDAVDWVQCDFDDDLVLEAYVYDGYASGNWTCPKCGNIEDFEQVEILATGYQEDEYGDW